MISSSVSLLDMDSADNSIYKDFQNESESLLKSMNEILENCESDFSQVKRLEEYGQSVDRIMGAAKSLAMADGSKVLGQVGDYAAFCKAVGYKASQIKDNEQFYGICVAFLMDATEVLENLIGNLETQKTKDMKEIFSKTFIDRLRWISSQFGDEYRATVDVHGGKQTKMNQNEIDELLKKLGLG